MGVLICILIIAGILIWAGQYSAQTARIRKQEREAFLAKHEGWDVYISPQDNSVLAVNHDHGEVMLGNMKVAFRFPFAQVSAVEVLKDGASISTTNRGSQLAGAAIGGLAFGGVGLLVGGLSGSRTTRDKVSSVVLKVIVDDRVNPVHKVTFFHLKQGIRSDHPLLKVFTARLEHFHALIANVIRSQASPLHSPQTAITQVGEIERLWKLKEVGAITADEFGAQKLALLSQKSIQAR